MKNTVIILISFILFTSFSNSLLANEPDSVTIFAYNNDPQEGRGGLNFAWSADHKSWTAVGPNFDFVKSDYSRWGSQKRMNLPFLFRSKDGVWNAVWTLNSSDGAFAYAKSKDLVSWEPQLYPVFSVGGNCLQVQLSQQNNEFVVDWLSVQSGDSVYFTAKTSDFRIFSTPRKVLKNQIINDRKSILVDGKMLSGTTHKISWKELDILFQKVNLTNYRNQLFNESVKDDPIRFANLKPFQVSINPFPAQSKKITDELIGIFFEDINYSADGGLYAELVQNRAFEYSSADRREWNSSSFWKVSGDATLAIDTVNPIHFNNPHYAILKSNQLGDALLNEGFDGIVVKANELYDFSVFAKMLEGKSVFVNVQLVDENDQVLGQTTIKTLNPNWRKYKAVIKANASSNKAVLKVVPSKPSTIALDMVSLFPTKTFKNRKNGLRSDLAQLLADMKPQFVRFPGGCVVHGDGISNMYHWKNTVGPLEIRKPQRNLWGYHQSAGLGYYEYFQFCEDIGAKPVPIVPAGVPCQNSAHHGCAIGGQQGGVPLEHLDEYIQDIFDLIEWANGDPKKNKWAKMRAEAGHPAPFNLKYLGIGNEELISKIFEERFEIIYKAVKEKYPDIIVIGTAGPFSEGSDYERGWEFAKELQVPVLDEHYYQPAGWFIYNQDYYDKYDRNESKVYVGEYASHIAGRVTNMETALTEAIHLLSCERNGDIVQMTSYAPLLAKEGHTQWNPDMIYFNNTEVKPTTGYYVQKLFGQNAGDSYIPSEMKVQINDEKAKKRFASSIVKDSKSGDVILKLVNILPVEINLTFNTTDFPSEKVVKTVFTGSPDNRKVLPVETVVDGSSLKDVIVEPYSFTIYRFKK